MEYNNFTPFKALAWENVNAKNKWFITSAVKVKYELILDEDDNKNEFILKLAKEQESLFVKDEFYGDETSSSIQYANDFAALKLNTDVIVNAMSFSKNEEELEEWLCAVKVLSSENKTLNECKLKVKAKQEYLKDGSSLKKEKKEKISFLDIVYEKSYGGAIIIPAKTQDDEDDYLVFEEHNPAGCGIHHKKDPKEKVIDAQIEFENKDDSKSPAGFGAIGSSWKDRLKYAGTYDQKWLKKQNPLPAHDFNTLFNQVANPKLIMDGYIKENSKIELTNLIKNKDKIYLTIPKLELITRIKTKTGDIFEMMNLDTVLLDLKEDDSQHLYLTYKIQIPKIQENIIADIMLLKENNG